MALLDVKNVKKIYTTRFGGNQVEALHNVSFSVEAGEYVAIMGESGSGKTTLLNILAALDKPTGGKVYLKGNDLGKIREKEMAAFRRQNLGFVFQDFNLLDTLTLKDNIFLPLVLSGKKYTEMESRIAPIAEQLGISKLLNKYPYEVSGGQKQRVSIAGVLAMHPKCIVLDEPTAMLDPSGRKEVIRAVRGLNQVEGVTLILITHYMEEIIHADKVFVMDEGKIAMQGTPREIFSQVEQLKKLRLDVPQVTLLSYELQKRGIPLPNGILTREELVNALGYGKTDRK